MAGQRAAKKERRSHRLLAFQHFGRVVLLGYALYRRDPVFILGQASGLVIYFRNLYFIHRETRQRLQCPPIAS